MSHSYLPVLFLLTVYSIPIFGYKEHALSDFGIDHPCVESSPLLLEEGVCYDQCVLLAKLCQPLSCFILYSKAKLSCYFRHLLTSYFCIPVSYDERISFFGVSSRRSCRFLQNCSTSALSALVVRAQTWITVILNVLPFKLY